jgi:DGQHR domain-containing protein
MSNDEKIIKMPVIRSKMLGVNVFRGFAELSTLSEISQADIYDQQNNPLGTQRDLSEKHAKDAYTYIKTKEFGFWPEVFLCARNNKILTYTPISDEHLDLGILTLNFNLLTSMDETAISRIDGNHRLYYADGKTKGFSKVQKNVSFCLAYDLSREEEIQLFKDINKNQKPMNTSHLDRIEVRLTPEQELKKLNPDLYIAQKLGGDTKSPFYQRIYEGGKKTCRCRYPTTWN